MFTVMKLSGNLYAKKWGTSRSDQEDMLDYIKEFDGEGSAVILCSDLEYAADMLDVDQSEIEIVAG